MLNTQKCGSLTLLSVEQAKHVILLTLVMTQSPSLQSDDINEGLTSPNIPPEAVLRHYASWMRLSMRFEGQGAIGALPEEPGVLLIRGPRQYGKSTWLECRIAETIHTFGAGSAVYLNGDVIDSVRTLREEILRVVELFRPDVAVKRLFIDEISAIDGWEKAVKYLIDTGPLRDVLVITTGSKASDLRRSAERLPGRKGKTGRTEFLFLPVPFAEFERALTGRLTPEDAVSMYLLSGGSPIACSEIIQRGSIPDYVFALTRDWILGEFAARGRSRSFLLNIFEVLLATGGNAVGYTKLARDAGLANNSAAHGYVELLGDLLCLAPCYQWNSAQKHTIQRKACKFHFTNLLVANAFRRTPLDSIEQWRAVPPQETGRWIEWLVAQ